MLLIAQLVVIVLVSRALAAVAGILRQPPVVGEMLAGLALGPSLFGVVLPSAYAALFGPESLGGLALLSQLGLVLFMLLLGAELDLGLLRQNATTALVVTQVSVALPMLGGMLVAVPLHPVLAPAGVPLLPFALFMGAALSVTAFPVLARILTARGLTNTPIGALATAAAAGGDVAAWSLVALISGFVTTGEVLPALYRLAALIALAVALLGVARPRLAVLGGAYSARGDLSRGLLAGILTIAFASAWLTHWLGFHALIGAFLAGLALPRMPGFSRALAARLGPVTGFLLPVYFTFTGLRTELGSLDQRAWMLGGLVILTAASGKFLGASLPARWRGWSWPDALSLGALMNTRGLMELVVANIGLDLGLISPQLFVILVVMALVTTLATSPLLSAIDYAARRPRGSSVKA